MLDDDQGMPTDDFVEKKEAELEEEEPSFDIHDDGDNDDYGDDEDDEEGYLNLSIMKEMDPYGEMMSEV
ncbi:MAG TPA: hypothetical protein VG982_02150 [Candidatus Paceibacterota bacterium]|nr:hypothetical protein [Candidatus Paceibacterota bacterium]